MIYFEICFIYYVHYIYTYICDTNVQWVKEEEKEITHEYQK